MASRRKPLTITSRGPKMTFGPAAGLALAPLVARWGGGFASFFVFGAGDAAETAASRRFMPSHIVLGPEGGARGEGSEEEEAASSVSAAMAGEDAAARAALDAMAGDGESLPAARSAMVHAGLLGAAA